MAFPLYTAILAALLLIAQQVMVVLIGARRVATRRGVGDKDDPVMTRIMRRHGNLAESAPAFLIVLGLLEMSAGQTWFVATFAALFGLGRLLHAIAFSSSAGSHARQLQGARILFLAARMSSTLLTILLGVVCALTLVVFAVNMPPGVP